MEQLVSKLLNLKEKKKRLELDLKSVSSKDSFDLQVKIDQLDSDIKTIERAIQILNSVS